jgi:NTP pyrophosphatase (non-canonical NTP hydrolase)
MRKRKSAPGLSKSELERLAVLAEECAEVIQVVGKIQRHGYDSVHPNGGADNRQLLVKELGDVHAIVRIMDRNGDIDRLKIESASDYKIEHVGEYLHHKHLFPVLYTDRCGHSAQSWSVKGHDRMYCDDCESDIVRHEDGYWYKVKKGTR